MLSWYQQLDGATGMTEVVSIARDYLATWSPAEIGRLPPSCRPGRLRDASDIEELHECTVDAYRTTRASGDELTALQLLTGFLVRASLRIAQLRATQERGNEATPDPEERQSRARDR